MTTGLAASLVLPPNAMDTVRPVVSSLLPNKANGNGSSLTMDLSGSLLSDDKPSRVEREGHGALSAEGSRILSQLPSAASNRQQNDANGLADKYSSTKLVGGTEVISQNTLLQVISQPDAGNVEVTQLFSFWRPNHPQSTARRKSAALTLTERQQDIMYALAGCADVRFLISRVHGQVRTAIEHQYQVDKFNFATWFKNRGQNPSKNQSHSLPAKRVRSSQDVPMQQHPQQHSQQQLLPHAAQAQQILQLPQCDVGRARTPPGGERPEQDARQQYHQQYQWTVDTSSWVRALSELPSSCHFPNLPQPPPEQIPVIFVTPSHPLYGQLIRQYADTIPPQPIQFQFSAGGLDSSPLGLRWQQSGGSSQNSRDDATAVAIKQEPRAMLLHSHLIKEEGGREPLSLVLAAASAAVGAGKGSQAAAQDR